MVQQKVIEKQRQIRDTWHSLVRQIKEQPSDPSTDDAQSNQPETLAVNENGVVAVPSPDVDLSPKTDRERSLGTAIGKTTTTGAISENTSPGVKKKSYKAIWRRIVEQKILTNRNRDTLPDYSLPADSEMLEIRRSANSSPKIAPQTCSAGSGQDSEVQIELTSDFIAVHVQSKNDTITGENNASAQKTDNGRKSPGLDVGQRNGDAISPAFLRKYTVIDMNDTEVGSFFGMCFQ